MYELFPSLVLGFHGCDRKTGEAVLAGNDRLKPSNNTYDWLGHGIYFWENDPERALDFARERIKFRRKGSSSVNDPFVLGAVIDLGKCFNLLENKSLQLLKIGYNELVNSARSALPENAPLRSGRDLILRNLDCAVIEAIHEWRKKNNMHIYDSVRGVFWEGSDLYPNAGFKEKNHIQICVRNPNCIKGYFRPLAPDAKFPIP